MLQRTTRRNAAESTASHARARRVEKLCRSLLLLTLLLAVGAGAPALAGDVGESSASEDHAGAAAVDSLEAALFEKGAGLRAFLRYAALQNPGLDASYQRWQASLEEEGRVSGLPQPRFAYGYFIEPVETRVGPQRQRFGIYQTLPWFGERGLQGDIAELGADAAGERHSETRLRLFYELSAIYGEAYYLERSLAIHRESLRLLEDLESIARARYRTGGASQADIIQAQMERARLADELESLADLQRVVHARLNARLGRAAGSPLPVIASLPDETLWPVPEASDNATLDAYLNSDSLGKTSPTLRALDLEAQERLLGVDLSGKHYFPDLTFGFEYIQTDPSPIPDLPDNGKDAMVASLSFNIPLWWGSLSAAKRGAAARYRESEQLREEASLQLSTHLKEASHGFRDAARKVGLYRDTLIPQARQALAVNEESFSAGHADFPSLVGAQRSLLEFELSLERARVDRLQRQAEIAWLTGRTPNDGRSQR